MPANPYTRDPKRFVCLGLDLNHPVDAVAEFHYPILKNVRQYQVGILQPRPGINSLGDITNTSAYISNFRRLSDDVVQAWTLVITAGAELWIGQTAGTGFTQIGSGTVRLSGDPTTLLPLRPIGSPRPWMYIGDKLNVFGDRTMWKVRNDGTYHKVGLPPPPAPPTPSIDRPRYKDIDDFDYADSTALQAAWAEAGDAANPTLVTRVDTTVSSILYDTGSTGWACVEPASMSGIQPGARLIVDNGGGDEEDVTVESVHRESTATTIASIIYDSGTSGLCSIALTDPLEEIQQDSYVNIAGAEKARVLSVTYGPDGTQSIRVSTASTRAATNSIQAVASFRAYFTNTHAAAEDLDSTALQSVLTHSSGVGTLTADLTPDLTQIVSGLAAKPDDYIHVSIKLSAPENVTEGRIMFDVDASSNDFTQNYYFHAFRPSDLTPAYIGSQTLIDTRETAIRNRLISDSPLTEAEQRRLTQVRQPYNPFEELLKPGESVYEGRPSYFDDPNFIDDPVLREQILREQQEFEETPPASAKSTQLGSGASQWLELRFRISDLIRVGTDRNRTLNDIAKVRLSFTITDDVTVQIDDIWLGGGYGPDVGDVGAPYLYRYRGRSSLTGVTSNFSPASRTVVNPRRQQVLVSLPFHSDTTEVDKLDIERFGGSLNDWRYVGTVDNPGSGTVTFTDKFADLSIASNPAPINDSFQPWPVRGTPVSGTAAIVAGTTITDSSTNFNTAWAPGTIIHIDGVPHTIYRVHSTSKLELVENAGSATSVSWDVFEPILAGEPMPVLFGPFEGFVFGCGDRFNPGRLYFSNPGNPDTTVDTNYIDITGPTEPLQNGCVYNGRAYVFSSQRMFAIYPDFGSPDTFRAVEVPNGKGLWSRWALAVGPKIWFLSNDGIYETEGTDPKSITHDTLFPLFPHDGVTGTDTNGVKRPNMATIIDSEAYLRLSYYQNYLYFTYPTDLGTTNFATLVRDINRGGWFYDEVSDSDYDALFYYGEEGTEISQGGQRSARLLVAVKRISTSTASLGEVTGTDDLGAAIACQVRTPSLFHGDYRGRKEYGDVLIDIFTDEINVTAQLGFDEHRTTTGAVAAKILNNDARGRILYEADETEAYNISLDLSWSSATATPLLYGWEPSFFTRPVDSELRETDWWDAGHPGAKNFRALLLHADTENVAKTVRIQYDNTAGPTIEVQHNGQSRKVYDFTPFTAHLVKFIPVDADSWQIYGYDWIYEEYPELATITPEYSDAGYDGSKFMQGVMIEADTEGSPVNFQVQYDGGTVAETIVVNHNGRRREAYEFETPFIARLVRLVPQSDARVWDDRIKWIFEPAPELGDVWETPTMTLTDGWTQIRQLYVAHQSTANISLVMTLDGVAQSALAIPHGSGAYVKSYVRVPAKKFKAIKFRFTSPADFRLFWRDCEVHVKPWNGEGPYQVLKPFGGLSVAGQIAAEI